MRSVSVIGRCVASIICTSTFAQEKFTLSGTVTDQSSGEVLIGVTVYISDIERCSVTNNHGFFSITLPAEDSLKVMFSYVGYHPQVKRIYFRESMQLNVRLQAAQEVLDEVVVSALHPDENVQRAQMSVIDIPVRRISESPAILGETDILKVVRLLPGVQSGNEGTTGFFVRGGHTDQNPVQLDEAVVYNPNHLFGLYSAFNSRALNNVSLIKGGFPAQYGIRRPKVNIQSVEYTAEFFDLYGGHDGVIVKLPDKPGVGNYYRFQMNRKINNERFHAYVLDRLKSDCTHGEMSPVTEPGRSIFSDTGIDGQVLTMPIEVTFEYREGDSTWVFMQSLDEKTARFYTSLDRQLESILNPFVEPVFIESQINGAIGIFGSAVRSDSVPFIYPQDNPCVQ